MQNQKVIEQLGYSRKEAKVYIAALALGEAYISDIALKVKMPRSSVQVIVEKLHTDGLMNFYVMRRYKYWVAKNPERLLEDLKHREDTLKEALPALIAAWRGGRRSFKGHEKRDEHLKLFQMIADASINPVLIINEQVEIEYVNNSWERNFQYTLQEVKGEKPSMLKSSKTPDHIFTEMWEILGAQKIFQSDQIIDKRKDGTTFRMLTTIFPLQQNGKTFYIQILDEIHQVTKDEQTRKEFVKVSQSPWLV